MSHPAASRFAHVIAVALMLVATAVPAAVHSHDAHSANSGVLRVQYSDMMYATGLMQMMHHDKAGQSR